MKHFLEVLIVILFSAWVSSSQGAEGREIVLADFEQMLPCSECGDPVGFRRVDTLFAERVPGGAERSRSSLRVALTPGRTDLFFQGRVRRMYLSTQSDAYVPEGPNAFSFWVRLPENSSLTASRPRKAFGVWTYHWRPGDPVVGGKDNQSLATDSMMHGYAYFSFDPRIAGRWVRMILSANAFQICRYYYHFYAGQATTDDLSFFPSLRQLQFYFGVDLAATEHLQIDQLKMIRREPTARVGEPYWEKTLPADAGTIRRTISIHNPTRKDRSYRVFISSFIGVNRRVLHQAFARVDDFVHTRRMQARARGNGGTGVVDLRDVAGRSVLSGGQEIAVPAGDVWEGVLVYHLSPKMLGPVESIDLNGLAFPYRRDTLTTSVIVWDPHDPEAHDLSGIHVFPSNADDGAHQAPPGFPAQVRPPPGWRSEDIPVDQVGGSFVSVLRLTDPAAETLTRGKTPEDS